MKEFYMQEALKQAKKALKKDEVPVGAIIVYNGKIISKAYNTRQHSKDATNHAEIIAIKKACKKIKDFRLIEAEMYVTLEPCLMCLGAILNARLKKVYFGASINKDNALTSEEIIQKAELNHKTELVRGVLSEECSLLISNYFKGKRHKNEYKKLTKL